MKKIGKEHYRLSTGKDIFPNCGYIGLCIDDDHAKISTGYDSRLTTDDEEHDDLTIEEKLELAAFMAGEWSKYRRKLDEQKIG